MQEQTAAFQSVLNEVGTGAQTRDLAAFIVAAWHGTLLRMKVERSAEPVRRFRRMLPALLRR